MDHIKHLSDIARRIADIDDSVEIHKLLDEVEFLYDAIDPAYQDLVDEVIDRLRARLAALS